MTEHDALRTLWNELDQKIATSLAINEALLRATAADRARPRVNRLAIRPVIDIAFAALVMLIAARVAMSHWPDASIVLPACVTFAAFLALCIDSVHQCVRIARIEWDAPLTDVQRHLARLSHARIRQFKWSILLGPLVGFSMIFVGLAALSGRNVVTAFPQPWVIANFIFGAAFVPLGILFARAARERWSAEPRWQRILDDLSGASLARVRRDLAQWIELSRT